MTSYFCETMVSQNKIMENKKELICFGHRFIIHETTGNYDLMEVITTPGRPGPPPHHHSGHHELFMVMEGEMEFMIDGKSVKVTAGSSIDIPANTLHTFNNSGSVECRFMNLHSPKGFQTLFETFGIDASEENAFEKSVAQPIISSLIQQAPDFDMHIAMG